MKYASLKRTILRASAMRENSFSVHRLNGPGYNKPIAEAVKEVTDDPDEQFLATMLLYVLWNEAIEWARGEKKEMKVLLYAIVAYAFIVFLVYMFIWDMQDNSASFSARFFF